MCPPYPHRPLRPSEQEASGRSVPQLFPSCYSFSWDQPLRGGAGGQQLSPAPPSLVLLLLPHSVQGLGCPQGLALELLHPFEVASPVGCNKEEAGRAELPLPLPGLQGEGRGAVHCSQSGTPDPLLSCHLLSGPGPVAEEKSLPAANMNDPPHPPPTPSPILAILAASGPPSQESGFQFARSTSGCVSTSFVGCQGCEGREALGVMAV